MTQAITTVGSAAGNTVAEIPRAPVPAPSTLSVPETRAAARHEAETRGRYQVQIHAETMRIITEVVDMSTGDVLMYFPPGYQPNAKPVESSVDKEPAEAGK